MGSISSALLLNVQSINPSARSSTRWKIQYIRNKVEQKSKHISVPFIALTETWLKPYIHDSQLDIEHYNISRCDRSTRVGGGVLLYSHESLPITSSQTFDDKICQALLCKCETAKMIICVLYRPPDAPMASFKACLEYMADYLSGHESYETCLLGDYNFPMIDWKSGVILSGTSSATNQSAVLLFDFMADNFLSQYILEPTRLNNCLDLFLSNTPNLVTHVSVTDTPLSDHKLLEIFLSHNPCRSDPSVPPDFSVSSFRSLDFYKADYDKINHLLDSVNWSELWELCDPEEFPELLNLVLLQICEMGCPRKKASSKRRGSPVNTLSRKKRKLKLRLHLAEQNPVATTAHLESLRNQISSVYADMRDAINHDLNYREQQAVDKVHSNPKYFYSYAKKFSKQKRSIPMLFNEAKRTCTNPEVIANILQRQFSSVFSDPSATNINDAIFQSPSLQKPFIDDMLAFSVADIIEAIDKIKPGAAAGPDDLPVLLLKKCKEALSKPIHMIWQHSMSTGTVPKFYKTSNIAPLHKKGSRAIAGKYRPVSLTSHVIKIYERVLRKQMVAHLEENNLLNSNQHGFRSGKSCLTQLLHHFDDIIEALSNGDDMDITGTILTPVDQLRDLGITVSSDMSWTSHIRSSCDKARKMAAWVFSVFHSRNTGVMLTLYKSLVRSHLEYCSPLWNPAKVYDIQELESVQRTFTSKIHGLQHLHYWDRLKTLSIMSLQRRRERYIVMHMWKILHGFTSNDLEVQFTVNPRLGTLAKVPAVRTKSSAAHQTLYETSFGVMGPRLWNCIPSHIRAVSKHDGFKHHMTAFMLFLPDKPPIRGFTSPNSNSILDWRNDREATALWGDRDI